MFTRVTVPATSANLGPGFDCFGLALNLNNILTVESEQAFSIKLIGKYSGGIPTDESNLVWQTMLYLWHKIDFPIPSVALILENNIPPARGLGSSSAAITGGLIAANALADSPFSRLELLQIAANLEGHPDNVTPAFLGGVTLAVPTEEGILPRVIARRPHLRAVALVPDLLLKTQKARGILSTEISRSDAVFNIAHASLLIEAFIREEYELLREGMRDKLHQDQRSLLIPGMISALNSAERAGAYGAALSGSGPTLLALTAAISEKEVAQAMLEAVRSHGLQAEIHFLDINSEGATIEMLA
ncbi:MAG: homoserine kinase [Desulfitobacteriaceae bacterium]